MNPNILVIGFGNPLRRDDGIGRRAIERLRESLRHPAIRYINCQELTPDLAEPITQASQVLFIDADCSIPPGKIERRTVEPCSETDLGMGHDIKPGTLLALSEVLYGWAPPGDLYAVGGLHFDYGIGITPESETAITEATAQLSTYVHQLLATSPILE